MKKRLISLILVLCMVFGNLPAVAFAAEEAEEPAVEAVEAVSEEAEAVEPVAEEAAEEPEELEELEEIIVTEEAALNEDEAPYVTATVSYTAQYAGDFLCAPATEAVRSDLAETYGYTDKVNAATAVSVLDVLVAAHLAVLGEKLFTPETAGDYLVVPSSGFVSMQFGVESTAVGFMLNYGYPNDGTESQYGGYNGTTVTTQSVKTGDVVEFFFYVDTDYYLDCCNWFTGADGKFAHSFSAYTNAEIELTLKRNYYMNAYMYKDTAEMVTASAVKPVEDAQICLVNKTSGVRTDITDAVTDEDGKVTLKFATPGTYTIAAYATEDCDDTLILTLTEITVTDYVEYTVTVNVAPKTAAVTFYQDAALTTPLAASAVTANGVVSNLNKYTLTVPAGTYWYSGTDGTLPMGSGSLKVTENATVRLVRHNFYSASLKGENDWTITALTDKTDSTTYTLSEKTLSSNNYYQYGLLIGGHKYGFTYTIDESLLDLYYVNTVSDWTVSASATSATNKTFGGAYHYFKLTVPADAESVEFYQQTANYVVKPMATTDLTTATDEAGATTYTFKSTGTTYGAAYSYRVSKAGATTLAGYMADKTAVTLAWSEHAPTETKSTAAGVSDDNSVLLNIDDRKDTNELSLLVGDTFKLRALRAAWQIIASTTGNQMIEPDFHYAVLSGEDVISVAPVTEFDEGTTSGNAKGNWINITAQTEGTAVLAVWYDGIEIASGTTFTGYYGATDPARYGYVVVTVGTDSTIAITPVSQDGDWDAEFDTVYYTGSNGEFAFAADAESVTVTNLNGADMGTAVSVSKNESGKWVAPVTAGSNLITITSASGTDYRLVRAARISITYTNKTTGETSTDLASLAITAGDTLSLHFNGLQIPIPKMSGIYNPGYMGTAKTAYVLDGSYTLLSTGTQYDFTTSAKTDLEFKVPSAGEHTLSGYISLSSMGDDFGNHRNITDAGRTANLNASEKFGSFGSLPELTFTAAEATASAFTYDEVTSLSKVSLIVGGTTAWNYYALFNTAAHAANVNNTTNWKTSGWKGMSLSVTPKSFYNTITVRYWYEGEEPVTVALTAGKAYVLDENQFTVKTEKQFNIEVTITPGDSSLGEPKVYSYVVMGGTANQKYVHPVLTGLTAKDEDGTALKLTESISYTKTDYVLLAEGATKLTLNGTMLQKVTNATSNAADKADTVVIQRKLAEENVGEPITVAPADENAYPTGKWTIEDLDVTGTDTLEITVTSYADSSVSRVYTIGLAEPQVIGQVHVVVENTTFTAADPENEIGEPAWTGILVETDVDITSRTSMMSAIVDALGTYSQTGADAGYISEINGLSEFNGGQMSGWMGTLNDWFTDRGFAEFTVKNGGLKSGDVIRVMYTCAYGADLGADWNETSMAVKEMEFTEGTLSPAFDPETTSYTLTIEEGVTSVEILPTAINKFNKVTISVDGVEYNRGTDIPVQKGSVITITCGSGETAVVYTIKVKNPTTPITAYVNVSSAGKLVATADGSPAVLLPVELDTKLAYTIDDILAAAHETYYADGAAGYVTTETGWLTTLWGVTNGGNYGYRVNNASAYSLTDPVVDGDIIDAYIYNEYASEYWYYESYSYFNTYTAETTGTLTLTLTADGYDANWNPVAAPCAGATITIDGEATEYVTDENGSVTLTFTDPGEHQYIVSAEKAYELDEDEDIVTTAITAPVCVVTANVPLPRATAVTIYSGSEQVQGKTLTYDMAEVTETDLAAYAIPDEALQKVTWKSSSAKVATVDAEGHVTFVKPGTVKITATAADGSKKSASVTLKLVKLAAGIELQDAKKNPVEIVEVTAGKKVTFKYRFTDAEGNTYVPTDKTVDWEIVNGDFYAAFATVKKGKLSTKLSAKELVIDVKVTVRATGAYDTVRVIIKPNTQKIVEISDGTRVINGLKNEVWINNGSAQLTAEAVGFEDGAAITWKTSSKKVATVDENGLVTFLKTGTVKITATVAGTKTKAVTTLKVILVPDNIAITSKGNVREVVTGKKLTLGVTFLDAEGNVIKPTYKKVNWISLNTDVATVKNGKVTAAKGITEPTIVPILAETIDGSGAFDIYYIQVVPAGYTGGLIY